MFLPGSNINYCFVLYYSFGPRLILICVFLVILTMANTYYFLFHICYFSCVLTETFRFSTVKSEVKNLNLLCVTFAHVTPLRSSH